MKNLKKILICLSLFFSAGLMMACPVAAEETDRVDELIGNLIGYYRDGAETDIMRTLDELKEVSETDHEIWDSIIDYWDWIENDMVENMDVAPDGLPNDNSHAFIVLGYALNSDGTMKPELEGRLQVALNSAEKYPNSYILVTGGVEKNGWTEGERMHDWLVDHDISEDRILVETEAGDTTGNAQNSFKILHQMPQIKSISMITSQYHLKRGTLLYYAQSLLSAKELNTTPIKLIGEGNAGYKVEGKDSESMLQKVNSLKDIAGVSVPSSSKLEKSALENIEISGDDTYTIGDALNIKITAHYSSGYTRDVTDLATIVGYDDQRTGKQTLHAVYTETLHESTSVAKDITKTAQFTIKVAENQPDDKDAGKEPGDPQDDGKVPSDDETHNSNGTNTNNGNTNAGQETDKNNGSTVTGSDVQTGEQTQTIYLLGIMAISAIAAAAAYTRRRSRS